MTRSVRALISRLGKTVPVYVQSETGSDAFNHSTSTWAQSTTTRCVRTYPNRNSQFENRAGDYNEDRALLIFEHDDFPGSGTRIDYDGIRYEVKSPTEYDTHVAAFGEKVTN